MSRVIQKDGSIKEVTNLGWLLRHWEEVDRIEVIPSVRWDCKMIAHLTDGRKYVTGWRSREILLDWLDRPVFRGRPLRWFGAESCCGGMKYYYHGFDYTW